MTDQGKTYSAFIDGELKAERERRVAYDARGQALVTTSGALVALFAGLAAFVKSSAAMHFSSLVLVTVATALTLFAGAAACGIVAGWNRHYTLAKAATLGRMLAEHWVDDEIDARNNVATLQLATVDSLRKANHFKAAWVTIGLIVQVLALVTICISAVTVIIQV